MFHVIKAFTDAEDNKFVYQENDLYPRKGNKNITRERIESLSSTENRRKEILIERNDFANMDIVNIALFAKIYDIKFPKGSKKEEMIALLSEMFK